MKILFLLVLGMVLNMSVVCGNVSYQAKTVFVGNTSPPVEKGKKEQKVKKLKKQPPKANSTKFGTVLMVLGIVFLAIAVTFGIVMLALFLSGTTGFILAFLGFLLAFLLLGIVYLYSTRRFLENYRDRHIKKKEKVSFVSYHTNKTTFSNGTMSRYKDIQSDKNNKSS